jgi:hypothetical protein
VQLAEYCLKLTLGLSNIPGGGGLSDSVEDGV